MRLESQEEVLGAVRRCVVTSVVVTHNRYSVECSVVIAKKMILVPHDFMSKLGQQQRLEPSGDLDSEMKRMLDNSQLDDRDRWTQYQQMLQRYLRLKEQERQPLKVAVEESRDGVLSTLSKEVVDSVPVAYRRKAKLLLQRLEDSDDIKWDSRGEVTIRSEMKRMLDNSQLDDRDRWTQYQQMLQRYLRLKEQERQPLKVAVEES